MYYYIHVLTFFYFVVAASVQYFVVQCFLMGGPNWFVSKVNDFEKLNIRKLYQANREVKLKSNLSTKETANAIRL